MVNDDDVRVEFDPEREIPEWFWDRIDQGGHDPVRFLEVARQMDRTALAELIRLFDELANLFVHPPFRPPFPTLDAYLEDTGYWVLSQGKDFFHRVWQDPASFWDLKRRDVSVTLAEQSFQGIPDSVWAERFPDEDVPGHRQA
ncbi:hypothetical protein [Fimbriiglobus ruber]|uniref:DUF4240 domain-containing protein n=1 Tax=Fimbriiglobus ruber TaxID=1908690 RepID=A0A225DI11_9BACT|nr:hypothetical protein [Fimbriiglobus ruber]OWK41100.1 hypothetical protein FRUB_04992 [Fimbriiglobus ruber]